jgi:hypothetical protein
MAAAEAAVRRFKSNGSSDEINAYKPKATP